MLCYSFLNKRSPLAVLWFPTQMSPPAPCGSGSSQSMSQSLITKYGAIPTHDTQPIVFLISKQAIPYRTCGGICCPVVSTPKIRYLADSSMTNHITWLNPTVSTIPTLIKLEHRSLPQSNLISTDGRPSLTKTQAKLNITKDGKTYTTLMAAWLSKANQVWTQILEYEA
jgi:hypothetical protein